MPLDPNIAMSFRMPQIDSPFQQAGQLMTLRNQMMQQEQAKMQMEQMRQAKQDEVILRGVMQQSGGDPSKAIQSLLQHGTPKSIELASKLDGLIKKQDSGFTLTPGARRYGPTGALIAEAPEADKTKEFAPPEIVRIQNFMDAMPLNDPRRSALQARIRMLTERSPGVTVNMPASSDLMQDQSGNIYRVRVGKDGKVEKIPLGDLRPPAGPAERKAAEEARKGEVTIESVENRIRNMSDLIQGQSISGGVVGPRGVVGRAAETAQGVIQPNAPTPALDFKNQQALLLSEIRELIEKDSNLSNAERTRLYETIGSGVFQTDASALRAMKNVLDVVKNKRLTGPSRNAKQPQQAPQDPTQRKADTVYMTPRGPMKWTGTGWLPTN